MELILFLVPLREMSYNSLSIISSDGFDWPPFGKERREELIVIEHSIFYFQLKTNGYTHEWKEIYTTINAQCNTLGIPYKSRMVLYLKEIGYLSLLLHDILPTNYSTQCMIPGDISTSSHQIFFSQKDSITIARKKWYNILGNDYDVFWDVH